MDEFKEFKELYKIKKEKEKREKDEEKLLLNLSLAFWKCLFLLFIAVLSLHITGDIPSHKRNKPSSSYFAKVENTSSSQQYSREPSISQYYQEAEPKQSKGDIKDAIKRFNESIERSKKEGYNLEQEKEVSRIQIRISENLISNIHLGDEFQIYHTCNGKKIGLSDSVEAGRELVFQTTIIENDSVPDMGSGTIIITTPPYEQSETITIRVNERGGKRYPNAYAIWQITYSISPATS